MWNTLRYANVLCANLSGPAWYESAGLVKCDMANLPPEAASTAPCKGKGWHQKGLRRVYIHGGENPASKSRRAQPFPDGCATWEHMGR